MKSFLIRRRYLLPLVFIFVNGIGYLTGFYYSRGGFVPLVSLGVPPAEEVVFLTIEQDISTPINPTVYIQSANGLYKNSPLTCEDEDCWQSVAVVPTPHEYDPLPVVAQECRNRSDLYIKSPRALSTCIALFEIGGGTLVRYTSFMLAEDGEIFGRFFFRLAGHFY